ncbi:MAG: pectin esterase [Duncaniella sp.]|nr:pectin esterase [Duncaniella sp.]
MKTKLKIFALVSSGFLAAGCASDKPSNPFDAVVAQDGSGDYMTVQSAIDAAPDSLDTPYLIFVKNGAYEEQVVIPESKPYMHLIGQDKEQTIIHLKLNVGGKPENIEEDFWKYSVHNPESENYELEGSVVVVKAPHFYTENISYVNDYGVMAQNGPQALAMKSHADCAAFNNCIFRSFQDTWMTTTKDNERHYVNNCWIEGAVDYLYGGGDVLVENSTFYNVRSGSVIVAPCHTESRYGYVIRDCVVDGNEQASDGSLLLGRPWHNNPRALYVNTEMRIPVAPEGWTDMGTAPGLFAEYGSRDKEGNDLDMTARKTTYNYTSREGEKCTGSSRTSITEDEASQLIYANMIPGEDGWDPRSMMMRLPAPEHVNVSPKTVKWSAVPEARGYIVLDGDEVAGFSTATSCSLSRAPRGEVTVRAVNAYGALGV